VTCGLTYPTSLAHRCLVRPLSFCTSCIHGERAASAAFPKQPRGSCDGVQPPLTTTTTGLRGYGHGG
jgi:hypothetical protein